VKYLPDIPVSEAYQMHRSMRSVLGKLGFSGKRVTIAVLPPQELKVEIPTSSMTTSYIIARKNGSQTQALAGTKFALLDGDLVIRLTTIGNKTLNPAIVLVKSNDS